MCVGIPENVDLSSAEKIGGYGGLKHRQARIYYYTEARSMSVRRLLSAMALLVSLTLLAAYFLLGLSDQAILWLSVLLSSASEGMFLALPGQYRTKLASIILFASTWHVAPMLRGGMGIPSRLLFSSDEAYQAQFDSFVLQSGIWHPGTGLGPALAYSFYPDMPILSATTANVLGSLTGVFVFVNVIFPVLTAVLPLVFYSGAMSRLLGNAQWALWSAYLFTLNEQFLFFDSSFSYESLGIIFFTVIFYLLTRKTSWATKSITTIGLVAITLTHFWSNFNLIFFLGVFCVMPYALRLLRGRNATNENSSVLNFDSTTFTIALAAIAAYSVYVATVVPARFGLPLALLLTLILAPTSKIAPNFGYRTPLQISLIILGQLVLVVFGIHGFLRRRLGPSPFLKSIFLVGGIYLILILFSLPSALARPVIHRGFFFAFFVMSPVIAWTVYHSDRPWRKHVKAVLLVLVVVSAVLSQEPWFIYPDFVSPSSQFYAGVWASERVPFGSPIISMISVSTTFGSYGHMQDLDIGPYDSQGDLILSSFLQQNVTGLLKPYDAHYVGISIDNNPRILSYFVEQYVHSVSGREYIKETDYYLNQNPHFDRILNSGYVSLYYADS